ncbi:hypothetical protein BTE77_34780 [Ensifer adhaerens]|nr:hypothetical protein BTE77_34780 [Ensifer adhaerens]
MSMTSFDPLVPWPTPRLTRLRFKFTDDEQGRIFYGGDDGMLYCFQVNETEVVFYHCDMSGTPVCLADDTAMPIDHLPDDSGRTSQLLWRWLGARQRKP